MENVLALNVELAMATIVKERTNEKAITTWKQHIAIAAVTEPPASQTFESGSRSTNFSIGSGPLVFCLPQFLVPQAYNYMNSQRSEDMKRQMQLVLCIFLAHQLVEALPDLAGQIPPVLFRDGYSIIWGGDTNVNLQNDKNTIQLVLDQHSGSGFKSKQSYHYGFFSASIKLPANYSAGVVTAFYTSNSDIYSREHDEFDFEFLGVVPGMPYVLQTNIYGNGSVGRGREERLHLWFDPTADFHQYSLFWNDYHTVFFVDNIPIRQYLSRDEGQTGEYPCKPMAVYATIWDGSGWATMGGKYPVDYSKAPFIASFKDLKLQGFPCNQTNCDSTSEFDVKNDLGTFEDLNPEQKSALGWVRRKHMFYSYCKDKDRYPKPLPECASAKAVDDAYAAANSLRRKHRSYVPFVEDYHSFGDPKLKPKIRRRLAPNPL